MVAGVITDDNSIFFILVNYQLLSDGICYIPSQDKDDADFQVRHSSTAFSDPVLYHQDSASGRISGAPVHTGR